MSPALLDDFPALARARGVLTWDDLPGLEGPDLLAGLEAWAVLDEAFGDAAGAQSHRELAGLVAAVAARGVVAVHADRAAARRADVPEGLRAQLEAVDAAVARWLAGEGDAVLDAEVAWVEVASSGVLEDLPPPLHLSLVVDGAALHEAAFAHRPTAERLDHLIGLLEHAVSRFRDHPGLPPSCRVHVDPRLSRCTGRLGVALRERHDAGGDPDDLARSRQLVEATTRIVHPDGPDAPVWRLERAVLLGYGSASDLAEAVHDLDEVAATEPAASELGARALDLGGRAAWADYLAAPTGPGRPRLDDAIERWQGAWDATTDPAPSLRSRLATARLARFLERGATGADAGAAADALGVAPGASVAGRLLAGLEPLIGVGRSRLVDLGVEALRRSRTDPDARAVGDRLCDLAVLVAGRAERLSSEDRGAVALALLGAARGLGADDPSVREVGAATTVGAHLMRLYDATGDLTLLVRAVAVLEDAADAADAADVATGEHVRLLSNLVAALRVSSDRAARPDDLTAAAVRADEAVALAEAGGADDDRAVALSSRAQVRHDRWRSGGDVSGLHGAVEDWRAVLALHPERERWLTAYNLGNALVSLADPTLLDEAVGLLVDAVRHLDRTTPDAALAANRLAEALHQRSAGAPPSDPAEARRVSRWSARAVRWARPVSPETLMAVAWDWGTRSSAVGDHVGAATAYTAAADALADLVSANRLVTAKETWLANGFGLGTRAARALVGCDRVDEAVLLLERARTLVLLDALDRGQEQARLPSYAALREALEQPALYLVPARDTGVAIVVDPAAESPRAVLLPGLTEEAVGGRVRAFHRAAASATVNPRAWERLLDRTTAWLGEVTAPALAGLRSERLTIVPTGAVAFLPVHAARVGDAWALADSTVVELAPALLPLVAARRRPRSVRPHGETVLAVVDPAPTSRSALTYARHEASAASVLGPVTPLAGQDADVEAVLAALPNATVLHLACHGTADVLDPRAGGLVLRDDARLTVAQLADVDLDQARLAFLSACETGVPGAEAPDEVTTLGSAFFAAGVDGVISSLWQVSDLATLVLVVCFYTEESAADDPARALASAQRRLRESSCSDLLGHLAALEAEGRLDPSTRQVLHGALEGKPADTRPFAHPDAWAGFVFSGVSRESRAP